jgi:hypothetical protein
MTTLMATTTGTFMGVVEACEHVSHDQTVERFQAEWVEIANQLKGKSS